MFAIGALNNSCGPTYSFSLYQVRRKFRRSSARRAFAQSLGQLRGDPREVRKEVKKCSNCLSLAKKLSSGLELRNTKVSRCIYQRSGDFQRRRKVGREDRQERHKHLPRFCRNSISFPTYAEEKVLSQSGVSGSTGGFVISGLNQLATKQKVKVKRKNNEFDNGEEGNKHRER